MSTHTLGSRAERHFRTRVAISPHWLWLAGGLLLAFTLPYVLTDVLDINRDVFYGCYAFAAITLVVAWARATGYDLVAAIRRRWIWATVLGVLCGALLAVMVVRTEAATARPDGLNLITAVGWRGIVYGLTDGLFLSAFPILVVFAAFARSRLNNRFRGRVLIGAVALAASLLMTAVYHAGYSDFRSAKLKKPVTGDAIWSVPTLVTLNPIGAPIAHAGLHVSAVLHSYETDTFLPPHN